MDLGANRALVSGRAESEVVRLDNGDLAGRASEEAKSGADRTEDDAAADVLGKLAAVLADKSAATVKEVAREVRVKVIEVKTDAAGSPLDETVAALVTALGRERGVTGVRTESLTTPTGRAARLVVRFGPEVEGDLAGKVKAILDREGPRPMRRYEIKAR
jgi:hypothetical protein